METKITKEEWDVISPDGIPIHREDTYPSLKEARKAFLKWAKQYERQGYYASNKGRIPLEELEGRCEFKKLN